MDCNPDSQTSRIQRFQDELDLIDQDVESSIENLTVIINRIKEKETLATLSEKVLLKSHKYVFEEQLKKLQLFKTKNFLSGDVGRRHFQKKENTDQKQKRHHAEKKTTKQKKWYIQILLELIEL